MAGKISDEVKLVNGCEYPPADEHEYINKMVADMQDQLKKLYPEGSTLRQAHPKMHGCVKIEFTIPDNLPGDLRTGIFKEPKTYDGYIRFSNANTIIKHDINKDVRGMSIKLTGVTGDKLLDSSANADIQDFLLITHDIFISRNVKEFHKVIQAFTAGQLSLGLFLLNPAHWSILGRLIASTKKCGHMLNMSYWSTTPYLFGKDRAVKYHVAPAHTTPLPGSESKADENYLRTNLVKTLSEQDVFFDFFIQFQEDPQSMPVEDPTVRWNSPFIKMAAIRIPKQVFDTEEQNHLGEDFSFSPWHGLPEHRPLGGLNRARKEVYEAMSAYWHSHNNNYGADT